MPSNHCEDTKYYRTRAGQVTKAGIPDDIHPIHRHLARHLPRQHEPAIERTDIPEYIADRRRRGFTQARTIFQSARTYFQPVRKRTSP